MKEVILPLAGSFGLFALAVYGIGLRFRLYPPFFKLTHPAPVFRFFVVGITKSRLRKSESIRDFFVFREGAEPKPEDYERTQVTLITGLSILLFFHLLVNLRIPTL
jgi:hypothetical protein